MRIKGNKILYIKSERDLIKLGRRLAKEIRKVLIREIKSIVRTEEPREVKATHKIDELAYKTISKETEGLPIRIVIEGSKPINSEVTAPTLFIDPIDGSRNWERQIGDPAFAMAFCAKEGEISFNDLSFCFIEGLRSGDQYYTLNGKALYKSKLLNQKAIKLPKRHAVALENSLAYIKPGYSQAAKVIDFAKPLMIACKDIRAIDNSATDLCELARGACDFIIEARDLSDFHNLLAFPILKATGCILTDLNGNDLGDNKAIPDKIYDFMAFSSPELRDEALLLLKQPKS
ncbi:inositol monophosphatase family protein [Peijinzhouia sedimentorum]